LQTRERRSEPSSRPDGADNLKSDLTHLEREALEVALAGSEPWVMNLRAQVPLCRVIERRYTGIGFFTDFACVGCVPVEAPTTESAVPVAWASHPDVESGGDGAITFNVFLKDGVISCLEAASVSTWPLDETLIKFSA
jgi:hypothetical protein